MLQQAKNLSKRGLFISSCLFLTVTPVLADEVFFATGMSGVTIDGLKNVVRPWEEKTGHTVTFLPMPASTSDQFAQYRTWLASEASDVDIYLADNIWAAQLAEYFVDLSQPAANLIDQHFPSVVQSQTVDGKLVAMPFFIDAPALYYRKDLLEKYKLPVPKTWEEMTTTARTIQEGERADGNPDMWGYIWQGNAYEGLTCNALEWVTSFGGGRIVEADGQISINNENAAKALEMAASWVGDISPRGVLSYKEEEARGVWQTGNAVFMRNWIYVYRLSAGDDSAVSGKFDTAPMPAGTSTSASALGGWHLSVSKFSTKQETALDLVLWFGSPEGQKRYALEFGRMPTIVSLYDDAQIIDRIPIAPQWKDIFLSAVSRPSAPTKKNYNEVSAKFWSAAHNVLSGLEKADDALEILEDELTDIKGSGW